MLLSETFLLGKFGDHLTMMHMARHCILTNINVMLTILSLKKVPVTCLIKYSPYVDDIIPRLFLPMLLFVPVTWRKYRKLPHNLMHWPAGYFMPTPVILSLLHVTGLLAWPGLCQHGFYVGWFTRAESALYCLLLCTAWSFFTSVITLKSAGVLKIHLEMEWVDLWQVLSLTSPTLHIPSPPTVP